jgi:hypothetical protein
MHERYDFVLVLDSLSVGHIDSDEAPLPPRTDLAEFSIRCSSCGSIGTGLQRSFESLSICIRSFVYARILKRYIE